jgi:VanZ family protein
MIMVRFWRAGFAVQSVLVSLISAGAYLGVLPTSLRAVAHADLVMHVLLIGLLAFFLDGALGYRPLRRGAPFPRLAPALVLLLAGAEEIAQGLSPRRSSSLSDYAADVLGVCLFCWLSRRADEVLRARASRAALARTCPAP